MYRLIFTTASLATLALARTDLTGCTSTDVSSPAGASIAWYVPGTGELCDILDCGGGRAPPKTTVPGCAAYSGTLTYSPSYLPGYGAMETGSSSSSSSIEADSVSAEPTTTSEAESASGTGIGTVYTETTGTLVMTSTSAAGASSASMDETTLITSLATYGASSTPVIGGGVRNGSTTVVGGGSQNGTVTSGTPTQQIGAAMETARVWVGGVAMVGLGAVVAAL